MTTDPVEEVEDVNEGAESLEVGAHRASHEPVILLVEDEQDDVDLMLEALKESDVHNVPFVARDGLEAMAFLRRQGDHEGSPIPDLVFLDLDMPLKSGREVLKELKADPGLQHIPVVVFSMSSSDDDILQCYRSGAAAYVLKPVYFREFVQVVGLIASFWLNTVTYAGRE